MVASWLKIALGCIIVSLGFELFMFPYKITPGGVWGMSVVLHELFPSIEQGWFGYMMDIPLLISGFIIFGPVFGLKTVFAALFTPAVMLVMPHLIYPDAAVQTAETLLWGHMDLSNDLMLASIFGAVLIGTGVGIVIREQATTAGTDIVAMILKRFAHMKFSNGLIIADSFVVLCSIVVLVFMAGETPTPGALFAHYDFPQRQSHRFRGRGPQRGQAALYHKSRAQAGDSGFHNRGFGTRRNVYQK